MRVVKNIELTSADLGQEIELLASARILEVRNLGSTCIALSVWYDGETEGDRDKWIFHAVTTDGAVPEGKFIHLKTFFVNNRMPHGTHVQAFHLYATNKTAVERGQKEAEETMSKLAEALHPHGHNTPEECDHMMLMTAQSVQTDEIRFECKCCGTTLKVGDERVRKFREQPEEVVMEVREEMLAQTQPVERRPN